MNVLDKAIKFHAVHLFNMTPYKKYAVLKYTCAQLTYWKLVTKTKIPLYNDQGRGVSNTTT